MRALRILFRVTAGLVGTFVTVFVTYLVVVNLLLVTGIGKAALNRLAPTHAHFEWRTAYSPWFMRVYTTGFTLRGEDSAAQWLITTDRANASLGAFDFFSRRVRLHDAWARGVTTHFVLKAAKPAPVVVNPHLWSVEIDDIVGDDVREVWIDSIRATDKGGRVSGGFYLEPHHRFWIRPTRCDTVDATVFEGNDVIASELRGTFELHIAEVDLRDGHADVIEHLDANARGNARVGDLRFADPWLHSTSVTLAGGKGFTQFAVAVERGEIASGSRAWLRSEGFELWSGHDGVSGTSLVSATVPRGEPRIEITAETYGVDVRRDKTDVARAPAVATRVEIDNTDLAKPFDRWTMDFDVPTATVKDLKALDAYSDEPMFHAGSATLKAHASFAPNIVSGHAKIDLSDATMRLRKSLVKASGTAEATLHTFDLRSNQGDLAGAKLDLRSVSGGDQRAWWANFSVSPMSIALDRGVVVSGMLTGKCKNGQLPLEILGAPGIVRSVFGAQGFTVTTHVRMGEVPTDLSDLRIIGNTIDVHGHFHGTSGAAFIEAPLIDVGVVMRNGESSTQFFATHSWYTRTLGARPPSPI